MKLIRIGGFLFDRRILTTKFCCDYEKCKGACCYAPTDVELVGASLTHSEASNILRNKKEISELCDEHLRDAVLENPIERVNGTSYTRLVNNSCLLCSMTHGTCALKLAPEKGIEDCQIPLSCELFPIVVYNRPYGKVVVMEDVFEKFCKSGFEKGEKEGVYLIEFLKRPIIKKFGYETFITLRKLQKRLL